MADHGSNTQLSDRSKMPHYDIDRYEMLFLRYMPGCCGAVGALRFALRPGLARGDAAPGAARHGARRELDL